MSRLNCVAVGQEVGHQVAPHQAGDFTAEGAVVDGHLRIAVVVVVGRCAVDVGVHAFGVLVVLRTVAVLQVELIAVAAEPNALKGGDEETGTHPLAVMVVAVHGGHPPEVHVADFEGVGTGHGQGAVAGAEVVVNSGVDTHLAQAEILVRGKFEHDVVAGCRLRPVERRLRVARKVVAGLVPNGQAFGRCRKAHGGRWRSASPFVRDGKRGGVAGVGCFSRVEEDALVVGKGLKFPANGDHQIERCFITTVEVVLDGVVQIEGEAVARLIAIGQGDGSGPVGTTSIVPLNPARGHLIPGDLFFCPKPRFFHAVNRNERVATVRGSGQFEFGVQDGEVVVQTELVEGGAEMNQALLVGGHAGFDQGVNAVIVGLPRFVDEGVLEEVLLKAGVGGGKGHRRRAVAVVDDVEVGQEETG